MKKKILLFLITFLTLYCCMSSEFAPTNSNKFYPKRVDSEQIKVYRSQLPKEEFIEIGIVNATGSDDTNILITTLKEKASANGGDAIIDLEPYPSGMSATVIRFID